MAQDAVIFEPTSQNTQVKLGNEIQLYGSQGQNRGRASAAVEKRVDSVRAKADALQKRASNRGQRFNGSSAISDGLLKAHGEGSGLSKTGPGNGRDTYYNVKSGHDGKTYVYEANTYRLIEVKD